MQLSAEMAITITNKAINQSCSQVLIVRVQVLICQVQVQVPGVSV